MCNFILFNFSKCSCEMFYRDPKSATIFHFGGQTEMGPEMKLTTMILNHILDAADLRIKAKVGNRNWWSRSII